MSESESEYTEQEVHQALEIADGYLREAQDILWNTTDKTKNERLQSSLDALR